MQIIRLLKGFLHKECKCNVESTDKPPDVVLPKEEKVVEPSLAVIQAQAGSISIIEVDFESETSDERMDNLSKAHTIVKDGIVALIVQDLINAQLEFTTKRSESWEQVIFGRGTINGILLVDKAIEALSLKYQDVVNREKDKLDFDPDATI